jgi:hypothetical protein
MEFCSLGPKCHSAKLLQYINKKKESYPFDWIYSNLAMINHCIKDDFSIFMDKKYYINADDSLKMQTHTYYYPNTITMFNHHNPLVKEDYTFFKRCINRFQGLLKSDRPKIFLYFAEFSSEIQNTVLEFNAQFTDFTKNYKLLVILYKKGKANISTAEYYKHVILITVTVLSKTDGVKFESEDDNCFINKILIDYISAAFPVKFYTV